MREIRDKVFSLRLTQSEYKRLKKEADEQNLSIGAYIRRMILEA